MYKNIQSHDALESLWKYCLKRNFSTIWKTRKESFTHEKALLDSGYNEQLFPGPAHLFRAPPQSYTLIDFWLPIKCPLEFRLVSERDLLKSFCYYVGSSSIFATQSATLYLYILCTEGDPAAVDSAMVKLAKSHTNQNKFFSTSKSISVNYIIFQNKLKSQEKMSIVSKQ